MLVWPLSRGAASTMGLMSSTPMSPTDQAGDALAINRQVLGPVVKRTRPPVAGVGAPVLAPRCDQFLGRFREGLAVLPRRRQLALLLSRVEAISEARHVPVAQSRACLSGTSAALPRPISVARPARTSRNTHFFFVAVGDPQMQVAAVVVASRLART